MGQVLLCNVGTRDVQLDDLSVLPAEVGDPRSGQPLARLAGAHLVQPEVFAALKQRLRLPLLDKAVHFIAPNDKRAIQVVLFATDQPETVPPHYRNHDTIGYAEVIRDLLLDRYGRDGLVKRHVRIVRIAANNPSDDDAMYDFYRERLPDLQRQLPAEALFHLLIAGGTPQMKTMLLFVGSEVFGRLARSTVSCSY